jgi:hypothetical protein
MEGPLDPGLWRPWVWMDPGSGCRGRFSYNEGLMLGAAAALGAAAGTPAALRGAYGRDAARFAGHLLNVQTAVGVLYDACESECGQNNDAGTKPVRRARANSAPRTIAPPKYCARFALAGLRLPSLQGHRCPRARPFRPGRRRRSPRRERQPCRRGDHALFSLRSALCSLLSFTAVQLHAPQP